MFQQSSSCNAEQDNFSFSENAYNIYLCIQQEMDEVLISRFFFGLTARSQPVTFLLSNAHHATVEDGKGVVTGCHEEGFGHECSCQVSLRSNDQEESRSARIFVGIAPCCRGEGIRV